MEFGYDILVKTGGAIAGVYLILSLFNVHWLTRIRTIASLLIGAILVGAMGWNIVKPEDPLGAICLVDSMMTPGKAILLCVLAFAAGFNAYLVCWPKGLMTAPLAAPAGMAVWVFASGNMRNLLLYNHTAVERQRVYAILCWEGLFWLLPVAAGIAGVMTAWFLMERKKTQIKPADYLLGPKNWYVAASVVGAVIIGKILIGILTQDVRQSDPQLGQVIGQPATGQIAFAVFISFLAAGYAIKYFAKTSYIIPTLCSAILVFLAMRYAATPAVLEQMTRNWSITYFARAECSVLPLQMVAFGALGAFTGYQSAIKVLEGQQEYNQALQVP